MIVHASPESAARCHVETGRTHAAPDYLRCEARTLRVRVALTVTVDRDAYALAYGTDAAESIREHVRSTLLSAASPDGIFAPDAGILSAEDR